MHFNNVVCTGILSENVYLSHLPKNYPAMSYHPKNFSAVSFKIINPKATCHIFSSGKVVVTGALCIWGVKFALILLCDMLRNVQPNIHLISYELQNTVTDPWAGAPLCLPIIHHLFSIQCAYDKKQYPGLIYRTDEQRFTLTFYRTGIIHIAGCHSLEDLKRAKRVFEHVIERYQAYLLSGGTTTIT